MLAKQIELPKIQPNIEVNLLGIMIFSQGISSNAQIMVTEEQIVESIFPTAILDQEEDFNKEKANLGIEILSLL